jgi:hypothetical protein
MRRFIEANQPVTATQVANAMGIQAGSVRKLHHAGQMHIIGWFRESNGRLHALYELGEGKDAPRPKAIPSTEVQKAYRLRHRALIHARRKFKKATALGVWKGLV